MSPTQTTSGTQRRSELAELRRELRDKQSYLSDDEDLWTEISLWLLESYNAPVGSLRTKVRNRLASLQEQPQHKLYDHPGVDCGEAAFPDDCEDCTHYGDQCPVLARYTTKQTLKRHFDEADDDTELQGLLSQYAANHHCEVLQEEISEWEEGYAEFLRRGERLRMELNANIKGIDLDDRAPELRAALAADGDESDDADGEVPDPAAAVAGLSGAGAGGAAGVAVADGRGDGPPPEDAERVAAISQSILEDDEEDDA